MKKKTWPCEHIIERAKAGRILDPSRIGFYWYFVGGWSLTGVDSSWKLCPICGAKRPKQDKEKGK